jgi:hypothetical protein
VIAGAIVAALSILATPGSSVQAVDYDFVSIYSSATTLADFNVTPPAVNSAGAVAFAASSSGLPVTLAASGACALAAGMVTVLGAGNCTITASQAGDATYLPAPDVSRTLTIGRAVFGLGSLVPPIPLKGVGVRTS